MLTAKLGSALTNRSVVSAVLVAAGTLAALAIGISLELISKSQAVEMQEREIVQYLAAIATQRQEVEAKNAQLDQLNLEIAAKSQEANSLGTELAGLSNDLAELQLQAGKLQIEIGLLQSKIRSDEQYISDLTRQLQETQKEVKIVRISHYGLEGAGIVFPLEVDIVSAGSGSVSVDVTNAKYEAGFQDAVRTAAAVASEYTGVTTSDKNIVVRFIGDYDGDPVKINGPSAGAIIAAMISAGLTDSKINDKVLVTGSIDPEGRIGTVGSLEEKTEAALKFGANILLVPESQEFDSDRMIVVGVSDIDDVMKYLIAPK